MVVQFPERRADDDLHSVADLLLVRIVIFQIDTGKICYANRPAKVYDQQHRGKTAGPLIGQLLPNVMPARVWETCQAEAKAAQLANAAIRRICVAGPDMGHALLQIFPLKNNKAAHTLLPVEFILSSMEAALRQALLVE